MDRFFAGRFAPALVLVALSGSIFFLNLGSARLWDRDEPRNAGCAAEMLERGDWVTPIFNDQLRHQKPALLYWLIMSAYGMFGVNEFAARFWSALLGVGTVLLTWSMGVRLFGRATGFWSGLILATMLMFGVASRAATPDAPLIFFMTAGLCCFVWLSFRPADSAEDEASFSGFPQETKKVVAINALLGLAVLAKGPIGWVLPMSVMGLYLLLMNHQPLVSADSESPGRLRRTLEWLWRVFGPRNFCRALSELRWVTGLLVVLAIALPWYLWVGYRTEGEFLRRFFLEEHVGRATTSFENHSGGWWFYPLMLLVGTFPWSVFAVPVVLDTDRWMSAKRRDGSLLLLCWMGLQLALFSLVQTKLPSYITPCYPAVALLLGASLTRFAAGRYAELDLWFRRGVRTLPIIVGLIAAALVIVARKYVAGHWEL
ncbi:MAG: ArnT family glycosyltransferase, partial [Planctomycetota bacterium]